MEKQKTAVQWLEEQIKGRVSKKGTHGVVVIQTIEDTLNEIFTQAKQMEKEQIREAFEDGFVERQFSIESNAKQYYESKYGNL